MQELLGLVAVIISLAGSSVYIASILKGKTKPHFYTHLVWGIITTIAFFAQLYDRGGAGSWAIGVTAASCLTNALLALKYGEKDITPSDRLCLLVSLVAILSWVVTKDPLISVLLAAAIDVVAFLPTFRKSWMKPWEENLAAYNIANLKLALSMFALGNLSVITLAYPLTGFTVNACFVVLCLWRRRVLGVTVLRA